MRFDTVENAIQQIHENLNHLLVQHKTENWFQQGNIKIAKILSGDKEISDFGRQLVLFLVEYLTGYGSTFYRTNRNGKLILVYSLGTNQEVAKELDPEYSYFASAINKKSYLLLRDLPTSYFNVQVSFLKSEKSAVIIIPLFYNNNLIGVL